MFGTLLCFRVSLLYQFYMMLRRFDAFLRLLLKGMQHVDFPSELNSEDRAVGFGVVPQGDLEHAAAYPFERLGILGHAAELDQLQFVAEELLCAFGKRLQVTLSTAPSK
jgi:hypothetical protein